MRPPLQIELPPDEPAATTPRRRAKSPKRQPPRLARSQSMPVDRGTKTTSFEPGPQSCKPRLVRVWSESTYVPDEPSTPLRRALSRVPSVRFSVEASEPPTPGTPTPRLRRRLSLTIERRQFGFSDVQRVRTSVSIDCNLLHLFLVLMLLSTASSFGIGPGGFGRFSPRRATVADVQRTALLTASSALHLTPAISPHLTTPHIQPRGVVSAASLRYHPSQHLIETLTCAEQQRHANTHQPTSTAIQSAMALPRRLWQAPAVARKAVLATLLRADHQLRSFDVGGAAAIAACACASCITGALCEAGCAALFPGAFGYMRKWHGQRMRDANEELALVEQRLEGALPWVGSDMNATIHGRVKSVRSTFEKVALRGKDLDDLLALRIIVEDEADEAACIERCHHIETLVQSLWPGGVVHVKDYVASPKENGYQSVHLLVKLPSGWRCEVQIRTRCMHEHAETGAARHGTYKAESLA